MTGLFGPRLSCSSMMRPAAFDVEARLDADARRVSARLADGGAEALDALRGVVARPDEGYPAVGDAGDATDRRLGGAAHPDRDRRLGGQGGGAPHPRPGRAAHPDRDRPLDGQGVDAGAVDAVPAPGEVDDLARPEQPHDLDLLLDAAAAVVEVLVQGLVLHLVPAEGDPGATAAAP